MTEPILSVENLVTEFRAGRRTVLRAVDGVDFTLRRGEILGLVGESGSGKSVTGYSIMRLNNRKNVASSGSVILDGVNLLTLPETRMREFRGNRIAMIFQDPMSSLHPMLTIGEQMVDTLQAHRQVSRREALAKARDTLARVGIPAPAERLKAFAHQLSGGMRQRVAIAIALLNDPDVIVADEPTTGLDVTIQAQILYEVQRLVEQTGTALIWITHDLSVVAGLADRIAVMYAGRIVEEGSTVEVINQPGHPYTAGLLASVPSRNEGQEYLPQIPGSLGNAHAIEGCRFAPRCAYAEEACTVRPQFRHLSSSHGAACVHAGDFDPDRITEVKLTEPLDA